jgi:hypothetical protein
MGLVTAKRPGGEAAGSAKGPGAANVGWYVKAARTVLTVAIRALNGALIVVSPFGHVDFSTLFDRSLLAYSS